MTDTLLPLPHLPPLLAAWSANAALFTFIVYMGGVFFLAWMANKLLHGREFMSEYFLGSRSLGMWAFALTFAATSASGGSFTGFPSKIYTHGWILAVWIASYMVVPICSMGLLGKRLNQVARRSGAITIPDVLRDRFESRWFGLVAVGLIVFFVSFNLVAQFKSGSEILRTLLQDVTLFQQATAVVGHTTSGWLAQVDPGYLLCLLLFAVTVIAYTTYGGFHAVVWTDVMQGVVMVLGVVIMLPLAIIQVGGLTQGTQQLARLTPSRLVLLRVELPAALAHNVSVTSPWLAVAGPEGAEPRLVRISQNLVVPQGTSSVDYVRGVELTGDEEIAAQLARLAARGEIESAEWVRAQLRSLPGQTVWLDARLRRDTQWTAQALITCEREYRYGAGRQGMYVTGPGPVPGSLPRQPGTLELTLPAAPATVKFLNAGNQLVEQRQLTNTRNWLTLEAGDYQLRVTVDGRTRYAGDIHLDALQTTTLTASWNTDTPSAEELAAARAARNLGFLPLSLAISFFFMWAISGAGQPSNMVRLMAFKDTVTFRRSMATVAIYYSLIYFPLVIIFCCARVLLPGMDLESDRVMPQMAVALTTNIGHGWLAGLLVAAPFAAVMSTVDSFLLMVSSAIVRDIYQRNLNPDVSTATIKRMSYAVTLIVGLAAVLGAIHPPQFLQDIIVYTGSGLAACFLAPVVFAIYWPRANLAGCLAGMLAGFGAHLAMYFTGWFVNGSFFSPYQLWNMDPIVVGLVVSFLAALIVTWLTPRPPDHLVRKYFHAR